MPWTEYRDDCPGCRPCMVDLETGKPYAEDSDIGKAISRVWSVTTRAQKQAFHAVTCNNSRDHVGGHDAGGTRGAEHQKSLRTTHETMNATRNYYRETP